MKQKKFASAIFDRKKQVEKTGFGVVEIYIYLTRNVKKYVSIKKCSAREWEKFQSDVSLIAQVEMYQNIVNSMYLLKEDLTMENFEMHAGLTPSELRKQSEKKEEPDGAFLKFMEDCIKKENIAQGTQKRKKVVIEAMKSFGKLDKFRDITEKNIREFDEWLHDGTRADVSVHSYHKELKKYCRMAFERGLLKKNPYSVCHFSKGKCKEREPLTENELKALIKLKLDTTLSRVRDLFIFSAYTGLAYADTQNFDFETMCEKQGDIYYIDGQRVKTGSTFYTPILPPAMEVLKKYDFQVPKITNQKANQFLHVIQEYAKIHKSMTTHVARHSFATLLLSHDVNIENVARMLGHQDIKTTQIYAKILKTTIQRKTAQILSQL